MYLVLLIRYHRWEQDFPGYAAAAPFAIQRVKVIASNLTQDAVRNLNENVRLVVNSLQEEVRAQRQQVDSYQAVLQQQFLATDTMCRTFSTTVATLSNRQESFFREVREMMASMVAVQISADSVVTSVEGNNSDMGEAIGGVATGNTNSHERENGGETVIVPPTFLDLTGEMAAVRVGVQGTGTSRVRHGNQVGILAAQRMNINATQMLLTNPRQPRIGAKFPGSWAELVEEWEREDLQSFVKARQTEWSPPSISQRYHKRLRSMKQLHRYKGELRGELPCDLECAHRLDGERLNRKISLSKHVDTLFNNDNNILRRATQLKKRNTL